MVTPVDRRQVEIRGSAARPALERADVALQGLGDHDRLLEDLLLHEVAVIALLDRRRGCAGLDDLALDLRVVLVEDLALSRDRPSPSSR